MNTISRWIAALALLSGAAHGQAPSTDDTSGNNRTAAGFEALYSNTAGGGNTASGFEALHSNKTGSGNTATGWSALQQNTTGNNNMASGAESLNSNTTGSFNTAVGAAALAVNTTGSSNTASGHEALYSNTSGSHNIALGYQAGYDVTSGSNNIDIGNAGSAADNGAIRIGASGSQKEVFISGIHSSKITGSAVYVLSNGRLGTLASSERYKTAIAPMGANTAKLGQLRPVIFKLKSDAKGTRQYGLIAEEVARVYPELVLRDEKGRIDGVRYDELAPMLLNEMQKQQQISAAEHEHALAQDAIIAAQTQTIASLEQQLAGIQAALVKLQPKDELVAQR